MDLIFRKIGLSDMKFPLLSKKVARLAGIDIQPQYLKLIEFADATNLQVNNFAFISLPKPLTNPIQITPELTTTLIEFKQRVADTTLQIICAVNGSFVRTYETTLNKNNPSSENEKQIQSEIYKLFPNMSENINFDFHTLRVNQDDPSKIDVLVVICRKDVINSYENLLRVLDFVPKIIDVNYYAMQRSSSLLPQQLIPNDKQQALAIINAEDNLVTIIILHGDDLIYANEQTTNIEPIFNWLNLVINNETQKINADKIAKIKNELIFQIQRFLKLYELTNPVYSVTKIILSGEHATIPDIAQDVAESTGIETQCADPLVGINFVNNKDLAIAKQISPALLIACGLAKRSIDHD